MSGLYNKIKESPVINRYMSEPAFRTRVSLHITLCMNLLYVGINILSFFLYRSAWFILLAVYYLILVIMRLILARYVRKNGIGNNHTGELKINRTCSAILLTVNISLTGAVLMMLYQERGFEYHGFLIYAVAIYTFYITIHAIVSMVKHRKYNSPVIMTTKAIALSASLFSLLALQTAMFSQFGQDMLIEHKRLMIALTGAGISITVITMSIYMIIKSSIGIRKESSKNGE
ncbi:MAG: hypothetical protein E7385_04295 [Ruminococcaceae bacterium]|nr:hypothetical protein [Oscillospiraceae bacterium]